MSSAFEMIALFPEFILSSNLGIRSADSRFDWTCPFQIASPNVSASDPTIPKVCMRPTFALLRPARAASTRPCNTDS